MLHLDPKHGWRSLVAQMVKNLPAMQETWVQSLGQEDPLEKGMATHSSILTWRIPWTEELDGLQSLGSKRVRHDWVTNTFVWRWIGVKVRLQEDGSCWFCKVSLMGDPAGHLVPWGWQTPVWAAAGSTLDQVAHTPSSAPACYPTHSSTQIPVLPKGKTCVCTRTCIGRAIIWQIGVNCFNCKRTSVGKWEWWVFPWEDSILYFSNLFSNRALGFFRVLSDPTGHDLLLCLHVCLLTFP